MKKYSYSLALIGGILAFFGFGLPWNSDESGAYYADSGMDTLITIAFIAIFVLLISSIYILKRNSNLNYFSITITLIVSSVLYLIITMVLVASFGISPFSPLGAFSTTLLVYMLVLGVLSVIVYMIDYTLFQRYWRLVVGLFLGCVSLVLGLFIVIEIIESARFPRNTFDLEINFIVIAFIASITTITVSTYRLILESGWNSWSTFFILFSCSVGLLCFLILFLGESLDLSIDGESLYNPQYGAFLSAVGYMLSMIGVFCSYETTQNVVSSDTQGQEDSPEEENKRKQNTDGYVE